MTVTIRPLQSDDLTNGFVETLNYLSSVTLKPTDLLGIYWERLPAWTTFVFEKDGKVVGTASINIERKFYHGGKGVAHIEDVAVHPDFRGQGIGRALVLNLLSMARAQNCYKAILDCSDGNVGFYEKLGFCKHDTQMRKDL